jgi:hypothetical protein
MAEVKERSYRQKLWLNVWLKQEARPDGRAELLILLVELNGIEPMTS